MRVRFMIPSAAFSGRAAVFLKLANTAPEMRGATTMTVKKEDPGNAGTRAGAEWFGSWMNNHDLQHPGDGLQVVI